jgi:hypothetical protein
MSETDMVLELCESGALLSTLDTDVFINFRIFLYHLDGFETI